MAKKKIKKKLFQEQIQKKAEQAQLERKNEFFEKAEFILNSISDKKLFNKLTPRLLDVLYFGHYNLLQFFLPPGINGIMKRNLNNMLKFFLKRQTIIIKPSTVEVNMITYLTVWKTIDTFFGLANEKMHPVIAEIKQELSKGFLKNKDNNQEELINKEFAMFYISLRLGRADRIVSFEFKDTNEGKYIPFKPINHYVHIKINDAQWRKFHFNGETHSAFQFGGYLPMNGFHWFKVYYENFDSSASLGMLLIDVYIQKHAIERLRERIDEIDDTTMIINTFKSFEEAKILKIGEKFFFEYLVYGHKAGYFVGKLIDGVFLIQTFLFITNNGTPEGNKLNQHLGIQKQDKMHLAIDKLSTFINLSEKEAQEVNEIFSECNLSSLFKIRLEDIKMRIENAKKHNEELNEPEYNGRIKNYFNFESTDDDNEFSELF